MYHCSIALNNHTFNRDYQEYDKVEEAPVFYPTLEEFKDFSGYVTKVENEIGNIGIFKVSLNSQIPFQNIYFSSPFYPSHY